MTAAWYLRSTGEQETHWAEPRPRGMVVAVCGARFKPPDIVPGGQPLRIPPPDPDQICPDCYRGRARKARPS